MDSCNRKHHEHDALSSAITTLGINKEIPQTPVIGIVFDAVTSLHLVEDTADKSQPLHGFLANNKN